jgi:hypothetical protein
MQVSIAQRYPQEIDPDQMAAVAPWAVRGEQTSRKFSKQAR